jgi:hypothetical protein
MTRILPTGVLCLGLLLANRGHAQTGEALAGPTHAAAISPQLQAQLLSVRRIYVAELSGSRAAEALRELLISSLNATRLFILTDNPERADAILKGAADDHTFTDTFDVKESIAGRVGSGRSSSNLSGFSGSSGGVSIGDNESHNIKERKHEAFAAVRLCGRDGDVLWATTEESQGGKFRGASADVAAKVARDLSLALGRAERASTAAALPETSAKPAQ